MDKQLKKVIRRKFNQAMREREAGGKEIRAKIQNSQDLERYNAWNEKRSYGTDTRWIQLAYGLVKGVPYKAIEAKVGERNEAYVYVIYEAAKEIAGIKLSSDAITAWLEGQPMPENILEDPTPEPEKSISKAIAVTPTLVSIPKPTGFLAGIKRLLGATS